MCLVAYIVYILFINENVDIYIVQAFSVIAIAADITWYFQGLEEFGRIVKRNVFFKFVNIVFIFAVVRSKDDLLLYVLGLSLITLISNISLWPFLKGGIKKPKADDLKFWKILPDVFMLFIPSAAISVYTVLDKTMIGVITKSAFENGYYEQALKMSRMAMTIVTSLGVVMVPRIGHHYFEGEMEIVKEYMYKSYRFVWMLGVPLCLGLCGISSNIVPWFFGEGFDAVIPLLRVSSFLILAIGMNNVTGVQYLVPTKRHNLFTITVIMGALVNFTLNCFLINKYEAMGAAIASVVAESVIALVQLFIVRDELSGFAILRCGIKYFVSGSVMFIVLVELSKYMKATMFHSAVMILCGGIVYCAVLCLIRDDFFVSNCRSTLDVITNKLKIKRK